MALKPSQMQQTPPPDVIAKKVADVLEVEFDVLLSKTKIAADGSVRVTVESIGDVRGTESQPVLEGVSRLLSNRYRSAGWNTVHVGFQATGDGDIKVVLVLNKGKTVYRHSDFDPDLDLDVGNRG